VVASYWLETLGCAKNQVDSDKLAGLLRSGGHRPARSARSADLVVVNTCAFIEPAREESVDAVLALAAAKKVGARLVVTGCLAERYGEELAGALHEAQVDVDAVVGFGVPFWEDGPEAPGRGGVEAPVRFLPGGQAGPERRRAHAGPEPVSAHAGRLPSFDLLNLPRPPASAPWAYVKISEGCDRRCGFCAIPSFRGPQRSRSLASILAEVEALEVEEAVLVAQDPVSWGRDAGEQGGLAKLVRLVRERVERVRLLYLYPSGLTEQLVNALGESGCPYFDLSLQHVSRPLLRKMRRWGDGERFVALVSEVRRRFPGAAFRSSFIIGYPGETEEDHDALLSFLEEADLDWAGFFAFSREEGTYAAGLPGQVPPELVAERARECSELQDRITAARRASLVGTTCRALVDRRGEARSHREAPEIDGTIAVPRRLVPGTWVELEITGAAGPDLVAVPALARHGAGL
jgi:ribosomal protein S12 methylthiotransferase